jgi:hypothetical protein
MDGIPGKACHCPEYRLGTFTENPSLYRVLGELDPLTDTEILGLAHISLLV